jgi:hypothetical protein
VIQKRYCLGLIGLAFVLALPLAGCDSQDKTPPTIDTTTPIKEPASPKTVAPDLGKPPGK